MTSDKPVNKDYPFYIAPKGSNGKGGATSLSSPQDQFNAQFAFKDQFLNLADDDITFTLLTESEFKKAETLADASEGDTPSENEFNPTFLKVESIAFKNGKMTLEFKDSEKK